MFFEQYSHEPYIAVARHWIQHTEMTQAQRAQLPAKQAGGRAALAVMEGYLSKSNWFGREAMNIADFSLYAYTHVAEEGGFDLTDYPAVGAWLSRVASQPGHIPMNPAPGAPQSVDDHPLPSRRPPFFQASVARAAGVASTEPQAQKQECP